MSLKIVFMGSPDLAATVLEHVVGAGYRPSLVISQPAREAGRGRKPTPTAAADRAAALGLSVFETASVNTPEAIAILQNAAPDVILVAAFGQILKQVVLDLPKQGCLNVHASLLPKYRGAAPVQYAIWNGDAETGVTVQRMVKQLDAGDILVTKKTPIGPTETSGDLLVRLAALGGKAAVEALRLIEKGQAKYTPQDPAKVTLAPKLDKAMAEVDWTQPAARIVNQIRALQPWPVAETLWGTTRLKIFRAEPGLAPRALAPGELATDGKQLWVGCGTKEALSLTEVQLENRKRLGAGQFLQAFQGVLPFQRVGKERS